MPNGNDRNWVRFCAAVDGFRYRFGEWPSSVRLGSGYVADLRDLLGDDDFMVLQEKLPLRLDERAHFIAEDEVGREYDYSREGFPQNQSPRPSVEEWLGVRPEHE
jgi:hypothetical protein